VLITKVIGNSDEPVWRDRLATGQVDRLVLDQWEAQKNRLRKQTDLGTEVALALGRGVRLRDGDVLAWHEPTATAIVAHIGLGEVMVIELGALAARSAEQMIRGAVELGHAIGNQHWPAVVKGTAVYVPLTVDRRVMDSVMRTHGFEGVSYDFVTGTDVIAYLAPHEARLLFGGAEATAHTHLAVEHA
jgi:urease accessory protein